MDIALGSFSPDKMNLKAVIRCLVSVVQTQILSKLNFIWKSPTNARKSELLHFRIRRKHACMKRQGSPPSGDEMCL